MIDIIMAKKHLDFHRKILLK